MPRHAIRLFFFILLFIAGCGGGGGGGTGGGNTTPQTPPTITSSAPTATVVNTAYTYTVTTTGTPTPTISVTGLPSWLTFNGTTITGTSTSGNIGTTGTITVTAESTISPAATQMFQVTVTAAGSAPAITSTAPTTAFVGDSFAYIITMTGIPIPWIRAIGLPPGLTLSGNMILGAPTTTGTFTVTLTAINGTLPNAVQAFTLTVLRTGSLVEASWSPITVGDHSGVTVGDINNDGRNDVVVTDDRYGRLTILHQTTWGTLQQPSWSPLAHLASSAIVADMDGDGLSDLVTFEYYQNTMRVFYQDGAGNLNNPFWAYVAGSWTSIAIGNISGDQRNEIVFTTAADDLLTIISPQTGVHLWTSLVPWRPRIGRPSGGITLDDINNDGRTDVMVTDDTGTVSIFHQTAPETLIEPTWSPLQTGGVRNSVTLSDLNADGRNDVVVMTRHGGLWGTDVLLVFHQTVTGGFSQTPDITVAMPSWVSDLCIGDVNGDGRNDVLVSTYSDKLVTVLQQTPQGTLTASPQSPIPMPRGADDLAIGDLNGDGRADVVVSNAYNATLTVLLQRP